MREFFKRLRAYLLVVIAITAVVLGLYRLMKIQLVDGASYLNKALTASTSRQVLKPPRGEIIDAGGMPLVSNKSCFNVIVDKAFFPADDNAANRVILLTAQLLEAEGVSWNDILPISRVYPFSFDPGRDDDISEMRKIIAVQGYATAEQCIRAMCSNYGISDNYSPEEQRRIAGVRYTMEKRNFSVANRYTFAEDISMDVVVKLKEQSFELDGIDISEDAARVYEVGDVVPHLIGTVGAIDADEYAALTEQGYSPDDKVGKSGIELAMESELRGKKGIREIVMQSGSVISDKVTEEPVPGNTVKLTIDSAYQRNIQTILENHIIWLRGQTSPKAAGTGANAGAIVVLNAKTGALLAAASSPTYDLNDYIDHYSEVVARENDPLVNRAVSGTYRPGSTFKTVTAAAALNEGIITPSTYITCNHVYTYWDDYQPLCTGWHGTINAVTALKESCNIFFYETGRLSGIDLIDEYAALFGLGEDMGLEIGRGIKKGYVSSPRVFDKLGLSWQAGNIVQTAIGQSETAVTPLQMASQAMMIANKGVRYRTYMVDSIYTYNTKQLISQTQPVKEAVIEDKTGYTFDTVTAGMKEAAAFDPYSYPTEAQYYTGKYLLTDLPHSAAIKTGTPQMTSATDTGSAFIGFYPADDPEIAFSGFIEHGEYSKFMVRQIIEAYIDENYSIQPLYGDIGVYFPDDEDTVTEQPEEMIIDEEQDYAGYYEDEYYSYDYDNDEQAQSESFYDEEHPGTDMTTDSDISDEEPSEDAEAETQETSPEPEPETDTPSAPENDPVPDLEPVQEPEPVPAETIPDISLILPELTQPPDESDGSQEE